MVAPWPGAELEAHEDNGAVQGLQHAGGQRQAFVEKMMSYGLIFVVEGVYYINEIGYEWLGVYSHLKELMGEFESRPWI